MIDTTQGTKREGEEKVNSSELAERSRRILDIMANMFIDQKVNAEDLRAAVEVTSAALAYSRILQYAEKASYDRRALR